MLEFLSTGLVGIMGLILLAVQIGCFIHAIKTGRPFFWLWLLFMFPGIAVIAYLLIEVRPTMGKLDWQSIRWKLSSPAERIRVRRDELQHSNTIKNRYRLSDELIAAGNHEEACRVLTDGMCGVFADDAELMLKVAKTHLDCGRIDQARDLLSRLRPLQGVDFQYEYQLAQARVLAGQGDPGPKRPFKRSCHRIAPRPRISTMQNMRLKWDARMKLNRSFATFFNVIEVVPPYGDFKKRSGTNERNDSPNNWHDIFHKTSIQQLLLPSTILGNKIQEIVLNYRIHA